MNKVSIDNQNHTVKITGCCTVSVSGSLFLNTEIGEVVHWTEDMKALNGEWSINSFRKLVITEAVERVRLRFPNTIVPMFGNQYKGIVTITDGNEVINLQEVE